MPAVAWVMDAAIEPEVAPGASVSAGTLTTTGVVVPAGGADIVFVRAPSVNAGALVATR